MVTNKNAQKPATNEADDLDNEVGKRLIVRFKGEEFSVADIAHGRRWREVTDLLARASGEYGLSQMEPAMEEILGEDQLAKTDEWDYADFLHFSNEVGNRIGASVGTPGESRGSRR